MLDERVGGGGRDGGENAATFFEVVGDEREVAEDKEALQVAVDVAVARHLERLQCISMHGQRYIQLATCAC